MPNSCRTKAGSISSKPASTRLSARDIATVEGIETVGLGASDELAAITAEAFREDPFSNWLHMKHKCREALFGVLARHVYLPRGFCQIYREAGQGAGLAGTMWMLPGGSIDEPLHARVAMGTILWRDDRMSGLRRGMATGRAMTAHHPDEPHAYLYTVAVSRAGRGRGLGRRLIQPVLDACDATATMAYLENSNPANRPFYYSLGFERMKLFHPAPGSPPLEAMRRDPR